jgi:hypothetical protein
MLALLLGACSADLNLSNVTFKPETMLNPSGWMTFSSRLNDPDLLNAEGQCSVAGSDQEAVRTGGISLHMTECEVVRRAGPVEKFEFGSDSRGRLLVLTYLQGPAPGIYRFSGGRLVVIERAPSPAESSPPKRGTAKKSAGS